MSASFVETYKEFPENSKKNKEISPYNKVKPVEQELPNRGKRRFT